MLKLRLLLLLLYVVTVLQLVPCSVAALHEAGVPGVEQLVRLQLGPLLQLCKAVLQLVPCSIAVLQLVPCSVAAVLLPVSCSVAALQKVGVLRMEQLLRLHLRPLWLLHLLILILITR